MNIYFPANGQCWVDIGEEIRREEANYLSYLERIDYDDERAGDEDSTGPAEL